jgi:hypothetical protein
VLVGVGTLAAVALLLMKRRDGDGGKNGSAGRPTRPANAMPVMNVMYDVPDLSSRLGRGPSSAAATDETYETLEGELEPMFRVAAPAAAAGGRQGSLPQTAAKDEMYEDFEGQDTAQMGECVFRTPREVDVGVGVTF